MSSSSLPVEVYLDMRVVCGMDDMVDMLQAQFMHPLKERAFTIVSVFVREKDNRPLGTYVQDA